MRVLLTHKNGKMTEFKIPKSTSIPNAIIFNNNKVYLYYGINDDGACLYVEVHHTYVMETNAST